MNLLNRSALIIVENTPLLTTIKTRSLLLNQQQLDAGLY